MFPPNLEKLGIHFLKQNMQCCISAGGAYFNNELGFKLTPTWLQGACSSSVLQPWPWPQGIGFSFFGGKCNSHQLTHKRDPQDHSGELSKNLLVMKMFQEFYLKGCAKLGAGFNKISQIRRFWIFWIICPDLISWSHRYFLLTLRFWRNTSHLTLTNIL